MRICKGCIVAYVLTVEYELDTKNTNLPKRKSKMYASTLTFRSDELTVTNLIVNNTIIIHNPSSRIVLSSGSYDSKYIYVTSVKM